jgi:hypothetical protein
MEYIPGGLVHNDNIPGGQMRADYLAAAIFGIVYRQKATY